MNFKYIAIVAVIAAALAGTMAITADNAFASEKNQATSQVNECGNGELPLNVVCQNSASQIQGDENEVSIPSQQIFEEEENGATLTDQLGSVEESTLAPTGQESMTPLIVLPH